MTPVVEKLRSRGYDIKSVDEEEKGVKDSAVLETARKEKRVLITFDSDFSDIKSRIAG